VKIATMFLPCLVVLGVSALAMPPPPQTNSSDPGTQQTTQVVKTTTTETTTFRVTVVSRTVQAVNYRHRGGATKLNFAGTDLMPTANGEAKVESKKGYIEIEVEFGKLEKPTTFGNEYLTSLLSKLAEDPAQRR